MKELTIQDVNISPIPLFADEWALVTAGTKETGFNTMTISWRHVGAIWGANQGMPTATIYIRPQRYTKEFVDREPLFTISYLSADYRKELLYLGDRSGRDEDKVANSGLTPVFGDGFTYFAEAKMVLVCRKVYAAPILESGFMDRSIIDGNYPQRDYHTMYIGEIVKILGVETSANSPR